MTAIICILIPIALSIILPWVYGQSKTRRRHRRSPAQGLRRGRHRSHENAFSEKNRHGLLQQRHRGKRLRETEGDRIRSDENESGGHVPENGAR